MPGIVRIPPRDRGAFSWGEIREINQYSRDKANLFALRDAIVTIRGALRQDSNLRWEDIEPRINTNTLVQGKQFLIRAVDTFHQMHENALYWQAINEGNPESVATRVRQVLDLPDTEESFLMRAAGDCIEVYLPLDQVNQLNRTVKVKNGTLVNTKGNSVDAFVSQQIFITDDDGGHPCQLIIINRDSTDPKNIVLHEKEHIHELANYRRRSLKKKKGVSESNQTYLARTYEDVIKELHTDTSSQYLTTHELQELQHVLAWSLHNFAFINTRESYMGELFGEGAGGGFEDPRMFKLLTRDVSPSLEIITGERSYGLSLRQKIDGLIDACLSSTYLSIDQKRHIWVFLERQAAKFTKQNELLSTWFSQLWQKVNGDRELFVSTLYTIPLGKLWKIGYFINDEMETEEQVIQRYKIPFIHQESFFFENAIATYKIVERDLLTQHASETDAYTARVRIEIGSLLDAVSLDSFIQDEDEIKKKLAVLANVYAQLYQLHAHALLSQEEELLTSFHEQQWEGWCGIFSTKATTDYLYRFFNFQDIFAEYLVSRGVSRVEGKKIVRSFMGDFFDESSLAFQIIRGTSIV